MEYESRASESFEMRKDLDLREEFAVQREILDMKHRYL
jgi:hypothetical protein